MLIPLVANSKDLRCAARRRSGCQGGCETGSNPQIHDAAYTHADNTAATGTQLYYIDAGPDALATTTNPNAGILDTIGALGFDTSAFLGFDIFTDLNGVNTAYVSLRVRGMTACTSST